MSKTRVQRKQRTRQKNTKNIVKRDQARRIEADRKFSPARGAKFTKTTCDDRIPRWGSPRIMDRRWKPGRGGNAHGRCIRLPSGRGACFRGTSGGNVNGKRACHHREEIPTWLRASERASVRRESARNSEKHSRTTNGLAYLGEVLPLAGSGMQRATLPREKEQLKNQKKKRRRRRKSNKTQKTITGKTVGGGPARELRRRESREKGGRGRKEIDGNPCGEKGFAKKENWWENSVVLSSLCGA